MKFVIVLIAAIAMVNAGHKLPRPVPLHAASSGPVSGVADTACTVDYDCTIPCSQGCLGTDMVICYAGQCFCSI
ncbi:unnamed protein product, partial [Iphiclides podalirius]